MTLAKDIASHLLKIQAVYLKPEEPFTWASGIKSPIYTDNRVTLAYPETRTLIENGFVDAIKEAFPEVEVIAGTATAGIPHGAIIADKMNLPFAYIRSKPKDHGAGNHKDGRQRPRAGRASEPGVAWRRAGRARIRCGIRGRPAPGRCLSGARSPLWSCWGGFVTFCGVGVGVFWDASGLPVVVAGTVLGCDNCGCGSDNWCPSVKCDACGDWGPGIPVRCLVRGYIGGVPAPDGATRDERTSSSWHRAFPHPPAPPAPPRSSPWPRWRRCCACPR